MAHSDSERLDRKFDQLTGALPDKAGRVLRWFWGSSARLVRLPAGLLFIVGGFVGFLPVLGFWMIPLGVLLLARDLPFLQRPTLRVIEWGERKWAAWRSKKS